MIDGGRRWKRISLKISPEVERRLKLLSEEYGFSVEELLKLLLKGDFLENRENVEKRRIEELQEKIFSLERGLYELKGKWSPLKFKTYYLALDNQNLAIQLAAMIAQNKRLRKKAGLPPRDYSEVEEKIHYYLNFGKSGEDSLKKPVSKD